MKTENKTDWIATMITFFVVVVAIPRWVGALMAAEGFIIPTNWMGWWIPMSAIMAAGMAVVEAASFGYVFHAWKTQKDKKIARNLLILTIFSALVFILVITPYIASQVKHTTIDIVLQNDFFVFAWAACTSASTITIVASVGYAQRPVSNIVMQPVKPSTQAAAPVDQTVAPVVEAIVQPKKIKPPRTNPTKTMVCELFTANTSLSTANCAKQLGKTVEIVRQYRNELIAEGKLPKKQG